MISTPSERCLLTQSISLQFVDPSDNGTAYYWDYKEASDKPYPNPMTYPAAIYNSYDPNWAFFIGVQFVQIIEEFEHLLPSDLVDKMVDSTYKAARNLMTRVGYDGDNLVTAYTNPALGRALVVEWVGNRINDQNLTQAGEQYAQNIYDLFTAEGYNTFGEYNVPSESPLNVHTLNSPQPTTVRTFSSSANGSDMPLQALLSLRRVNTSSRRSGRTLLNTTTSKLDSPRPILIAAI